MASLLKLILILQLLVTFEGRAEQPTPSQTNPEEKTTPVKNKLNANIFEKEEESYSFSGKVRTIRETSEDVEVFFDIEKPKGAFTLPKNDKQPTYMKKLEKSRAPRGKPVSIQADKNKVITSVEYSD